MKCTKSISQKPDYEIYEENSRFYGHIFGGPTVEFPSYAEAYEYYLELELEREDD